MTDPHDTDLRRGIRDERRPPADRPARPRSFPVESPPATSVGPVTPTAVAPSAPPLRDQGSILDRYTAPPTVVITHERVVDGDDAERLHDAYRANFDPLSAVAVQSQSSGRDEMMAEFADPRIIKIVARERGVPVGLGMVTNHLEAVPDINPDFLRASFPSQAERDAIYLGMYVMVVPGHRGLTLFHRLYLEMWQLPAKVGGVMVFDVCEFNRTTFDTDVLAQKIASNFPRSSVDVLDRQTWYAAELPEPLPVSGA